MCLGIPGEVIELLDRQDLAKVNVSGVRRAINIGLLEGVGQAYSDELDALAASNIE